MENHMRTIFTEAEIRAHCHAAGKTCKTMTGCTCAAGSLVGIGDYVQGPTDWGALDNPDNEPEQSMSAPAWLGYLLLLAVGFCLGAAANWILGARP
jgi:hypothetical protein